MLSFKHGAKVGGCFVVQHQTEETVAAVLLAWEGEDSKVLRKLKLCHPCQKNMTVNPVLCHTSGEGVCVPVR